MIKRQGRDHHRWLDSRELWPEPSYALLDIGDEISVKQHGALGRTGRAAGILQDREIVGRN